MKRFFKIIILCLPLFALCSEAAWACRPNFFNWVTGSSMPWNGPFNNEFVFPWNTNAIYFQPITPPVPCSENSKPMQLQHAPAVWLRVDSTGSPLHAYILECVANEYGKTRVST